MVSTPRRCKAISTSLPSSPEPSNMTRVAEGERGVPRVVIRLLRGGLENGNCTTKPQRSPCFGPGEREEGEGKGRAGQEGQEGQEQSWAGQRLQSGALKS